MSGRALIDDERGTLPKARVEAFSDGVIAIIVTILVLDIKVPALAGPDPETALRNALLQAFPLVLAYVLSFTVLLVFWVAHHHLLHSLKRVDRNVLWLNGLFLMVLAFVPAPTALMGEHPRLAGAAVIYGLVLTLAGLSFFGLRWYATGRAALIDRAIGNVVAKRALRRSLLSPALYALGAALASVDVRVAWLLFAAVPLIFIVPSGFDHAAHRIDRA
ncbi:MAG TPA: TMEM175 family protein [Caldimonas sp.]|nr:TMEM175 family protein [Caldimonas sp.]